MRRFALTVMACLLGVCAPAAAQSSSSSTNSGSAPTGNSSVNQYIETIPTDNGNRPTNSLHAHGSSGKKHGNGSGAGGVGGGGSGGGAGGGGGGGSGGGAGGSSTGGSNTGGSTTGIGFHGAIPQSTQKALNARGSDGRAATAVAIGTAPSLSGRGQSSASSETSRSGLSGSGSGSTGGSSGLGSVLAALTGSTSSGGMGALLPVILAVVLIGAGGMAILRRRRQT